MNAEIYRSVLQDVMLPYARDKMSPTWKSMHDNDPKHTARIVKSFLSKEKVELLEWPPQSPDVNPIENLRDTVDKRINRSASTSLQGLWEEIKTAWYATTQKECKRLVDSMERRCRAVLKNRGFPTKY